MITLYTHTNNILKKEFWKYTLKKLFGKYSGPNAVFDSLVRGLTELNIPFEVNPISPKYDIVHVLSGVQVLGEMVKKKKKNKIRKLIVGPTTVQTPYDYNNLIQDRGIDLLLFPSQWPKDWFVSLEPHLEEKIKIWPAGVKIPNQISQKKHILVFKKTIPDDIYEKILRTMDDKKIQYDIITYGTYSRTEYQQKLLSAKALIYLQVSESQGLALQEAWSYDIPTFVWQNQNWKYNQYSWKDPHLAAPYLTQESGAFFTPESLGTLLDDFGNGSITFQPKKYCMEHLSDKKSAEIYLKIINNTAHA